MRPIPKKLKAELVADPFYKQCCISGVPFGKIEWHHNFIFAGKQLNEKWCILPLAKRIHDQIERHKEKCDWIMLNRADEQTLKKYSKSEDLVAKRNRLNKKFGEFFSKTDKQRTIQQNRALHLYFQLIADTLNDAGLDMRAVLKPEVEIPWSGETVKNYLWRPIQKLQLLKTSTTELSTKDIDIVFDTLNRYLAKHGIHQDFPSLEEVTVYAKKN